ncbi:hypothetical protein A3H38_02970 [candidate division WOR-1 bacterium RIFCSPLOWO2_02_FULL_46_20]|uniref:Organic solvent tolerance-like N-terminal domain-containing protein n=2 Tax=Saganbacteria TaxID=1703751 RepID=A0A1F4R908_UNCSA|nr:MAG: hypothetical protein A3H38_02970 [candidate division WOR-1 bacterium RIFCSPLOWO2_02_FULL_46_20]OGC08854.1 MAG: hypothetical protein A3F86_00210 [candidate division WOR-1 bacterium RIFCSPLOWO2_12_FULL_45_9]
MKTTYKVILVIALIFVVGIFLWALFAPKETISNRIQQTLKEQEQRADLSFKDVTFEEVVAAVKYWQLKAKSAMVNKSSEVATLKEVNGTFFKNGKAVLAFISPIALWDMKTKEILLDNPLGQGSGYSFKADNLSWKLADQKLFCSGGIIINRGEAIGYADELKSDVGLETITLQGHPKITIAPKGFSTLTLEADVFEVISADNSIVAKGNPRITWREAKIHSGKIRYKQKNNVIELAGDVGIDYKDIQAWGNTALYKPEDGSIILAGKARAEQGENKLKGDEVIVSLKEQKISVRGRGKVIITEEDLITP